MIWLILVVLWLVCGMMAGGLMFASYQRTFPSGAYDIWTECLFMFGASILGGLSALIAATIYLCNHGYRGFMLPTKHQKELAMIIQKRTRGESQ